MAQWKRAGPITQTSVERNHALLTSSFLFFLFVFRVAVGGAFFVCLFGIASENRR